jgi:hypothetical protein
MVDWLAPTKCMFWRLDDNHTPVQCETFEEYFASVEKDHQVAETWIADGVRVSTIFLPVGHGFIENPAFFETMVFGGPLDHCQVRYRTWDEAAAGHERLCTETRRLLALPPAELEAEMSRRTSERFRFIREQALAVGVPEEIADHLGRALNQRNAGQRNAGQRNADQTKRRPTKRLPRKRPE